MLSTAIDYALSSNCCDYLQNKFVVLDYVHMHIIILQDYITNEQWNEQQANYIHSKRYSGDLRT